MFITALVNALLKGGRFPAFEAMSGGRITRCYLEPQPDDTLPRFAYEAHAKALSGEARHWPESTSRTGMRAAASTPMTPPLDCVRWGATGTPSSRRRCASRPI